MVHSSPPGKLQHQISSSNFGRSKMAMYASYEIIREIIKLYFYKKMTKESASGVFLLFYAVILFMKVL